MDKSRVSPFIVGLKRSEVKSGPILQFQSTITDKDDVCKLLQSINEAGTQPLDSARLVAIFEVWWPQLAKELSAIESAAKSAPVPAHESKKGHSAEILEEVLELLRQQNRVINSPADLLPPSYLREMLNRGDDSPGGHPVFGDLAERWKQLHVLEVEYSDRKTIPAAVVFDAIGQLDGPVQYILQRWGHFPRSFRRISRTPVVRQGKLEDQ